MKRYRRIKAFGFPLKMQEFYLIIKTGCDGIDEIKYPTENPKEAVRKLKYFRNRDFDDYKRRYKGLMRKFRPKRKEIFDYWCIQKWNGEKFVCACSELNVKPSKPMLR